MPSNNRNMSPKLSEDGGIGEADLRGGRRRRTMTMRRRGSDNI